MAVKIGSVPKSSATVVAVVNFRAYTKLIWFTKSSAVQTIIRSHCCRPIRNERSNTSVIATKIRAAQAYRTAEYASGRKPSLRMYFETVKLSAQRLTVPSSIRSAVERRTGPLSMSLGSLERGRGAAVERRLLQGAPATRLLAAACRRCRHRDRLQDRAARLRSGRLCVRGKPR